MAGSMPAEDARLVQGFALVKRTVEATTALLTCRVETESQRALVKSLIMAVGGLLLHQGQGVEQCIRPEHPGTLLHDLAAFLQRRAPPSSSDGGGTHTSPSSSSSSSSSPTDSSSLWAGETIGPLLKDFIRDQPVHASGLVLQYLNFKAQQPSGLHQLHTSPWRATLCELCQAAAAYLQQAVYAGLVMRPPPRGEASTTAPAASATAAVAATANGVTGATGGQGGDEGRGPKGPSGSAGVASTTSSASHPSSSSSDSGDRSRQPATEGLSWVPPVTQWLHPLLQQLHPLHVLQLAAQLLLFLGRPPEQSVVGLDETNMDSPLHAAVMGSLLRLLELLLRSHLEQLQALLQQDGSTGLPDPSEQQHQAHAGGSATAAAPQQQAGGVEFAGSQPVLFTWSLGAAAPPAPTAAGAAGTPHSSSSSHGHHDHLQQQPQQQQAETLEACAVAPVGLSRPCIANPLVPLVLARSARQGSGSPRQVQGEAVGATPGDEGTMAPTAAAAAAAAGAGTAAGTAGVPAGEGTYVPALDAALKQLHMDASGLKISSSSKDIAALRAARQAVRVSLAAPGVRSCHLPASTGVYLHGAVRSQGADLLLLQQQMQAHYQQRQQAAQAQQEPSGMVQVPAEGHALEDAAATAAAAAAAGAADDAGVGWGCIGYSSVVAWAATGAAAAAALVQHNTRYLSAPGCLPALVGLQQMLQLQQQACLLFCALVLEVQKPNALPVTATASTHGGTASDGSASAAGRGMPQSMGSSDHQQQSASPTSSNQQQQQQQEQSCQQHHEGQQLGGALPVGVDAFQERAQAALSHVWLACLESGILADELRARSSFPEACTSTAQQQLEECLGSQEPAVRMLAHQIQRAWWVIDSAVPAPGGKALPVYHQQQQAQDGDNIAAAGAGALEKATRCNGQGGPQQQDSTTSSGSSSSLLAPGTQQRVHQLSEEEFEPLSDLVVRMGHLYMAARATQAAMEDAHTADEEYHKHLEQYPSQDGTTIVPKGELGAFAAKRAACLEARQQVAKHLQVLAVERGQLEMVARGGRPNDVQLSRIIRWSLAAAATIGAAAAAVAGGGDGESSSSSRGLGNVHWEDSDDEKVGGLQVISLKAGVQLSLPPRQAPFAERPVKVCPGPAGICFPLVLLKGMRAPHADQLPQDLQLAAAAAADDSPFQAGLAPCYTAVFDHAQKKEQDNQLLEVQMRAAAAVCLQALAAVGVVNPTWSTLGFDQPEERPPAAEPGAAVAWGPLGLRQVVAQLSEDDQFKVVKLAMALFVKGDQRALGAYTRLLPVSYQPRVVVLQQPTAAAGGAAAGAGRQAECAAAAPSLPAALAAPAAPAGAALAAACLALLPLLGPSVAMEKLSVGLTGPIGKPIGSSVHATLAAGRSRRQLQQVMQGLLTRQQAPQPANHHQQRQEEGVVEQWAEAAELAAQQAAWMLQQLPGVAADVWRPSPAWQVLLGQLVAGDTLQGNLAHQLSQLCGCDGPRGSATSGAAAKLPASPSSKQPEDSSQAPALESPSAAAAGGSSGSSSPVPPAAPSPAAAGVGEQAAAANGFAAGACQGLPFTLRQLGRAVRINLTAPSLQGSSITLLQWLLIGEALTSTPGHIFQPWTGSMSHLVTAGLPQTPSHPLGSPSSGSAAAGVASREGSQGGSSALPAQQQQQQQQWVRPLSGWHMFDEGAASSVLGAALWDGGAGSARLAAKAAAAGAAGSSSSSSSSSMRAGCSPPPPAAAVGGTAAGVEAAAGLGISGWPSEVLLPVQQDAAWESVLMHFAGAWHATMQATQLSYNIGFDRALGAMEAAIALGGQWMTEAETTVPAVQQYHAGLHTLEGASCFTPGQLPLFAHSACGKPAAALGQLWWPQDTACDCCGRRMEPAELIVCPECNVAWYCCKDHEVQARRKGLHSYPACRMLNQWRMGNFAYTEWA